MTEFNRPRLGVWLLFCQEPTDRALDGWNGLGDFSFLSANSEQFFVEYVSDELTL